MESSKGESSKTMKRRGLTEELRETLDRELRIRSKPLSYRKYKKLPATGQSKTESTTTRGCKYYTTAPDKKKGVENEH